MQNFILLNPSENVEFQNIKEHFIIYIVIDYFLALVAICPVLLGPLYLGILP